MTDLLATGLCLIAFALPVGLGALTQLNPEEWARVSANIRKAILITYGALKSAAHAMGVDQAQLSRMLDGSESFPMHRYLRLDADTRRWVAVFDLADNGLPKEMGAAASIAMALNSEQKRSA